MATRPTLKQAVAKTKNKASDYNDNFDLMMQFVDDSIDEAKDYVDDFMPSVTGQSGKVLTNDGTEASWTALPSYTGFVKWYAGENAPNGWLVCDGSAISRTTYAALYAIIGTTYGSGDESTTFNLPDLVDKFIEGSSTAGTEKSAGLPNITGAFSGGVNMVVSGAFNADSTSGGTQQGGGFGETKYSFDASRSSAIYGNSSTVQPPALTLLPIIKY